MYGTLGAPVRLTLAQFVGITKKSLIKECSQTHAQHKVCFEDNVGVTYASTHARQTQPKRHCHLHVLKSGFDKTFFKDPGSKAGGNMSTGKV